MKPEEMSEESLLEQLIEECGELIQAGAKRLRILRGENPTPVTKDENLANLREEINDVSLCIDVLDWKFPVLFSTEKAKKYERWCERLAEAEK